MSEAGRISRRERSYTYWGGVAAVAALTLTGCGIHKRTTTVTQAPLYEAERPDTQTFDPSTLAPRPEGSVLVFDPPQSSGEPSMARAYVGPEDTPSDKKVIATFPAGDSAPAECKTEGRLMYTSTSTGQEIVSDEWVRIRVRTEGELEEIYTPIVNAENPGSLSPQLPNC